MAVTRPDGAQTRLGLFYPVSKRKQRYRQRVSECASSYGPRDEKSRHQVYRVDD